MFLDKHILIFTVQLIFVKTSVFHRDNECSDEEEQPSPVEFYKKDDSLFILFSEKVSWFEGLSICKTYEAEPCILNSTSKAKFVGYFLAESNFRKVPLNSVYSLISKSIEESEDFWVGAKKSSGEWLWLNGQLLTDTNVSIPWSKTSDENGKDCLAVERRTHFSPMLVGLLCFLPKPFICERPLTARTNKPLPSLPAHSVKINESIFTFYHSRITWNEALGFCRTLGQRLAVIRNEKVMTFLKSEMLRTRPNMENAWIGAYYYQNSWVWISTGLKIADEIGTDGYPPWQKDNKKKYKEGCLLFDRHFTSVNFLPARCQRRKDFICEQYVHTHEVIHIENDTITCTHNFTEMYIYLTDKKWTDAQKFCNDKDMILAEPTDNEALKTIAVCLGDHPAEPRHVWLGGKYDNDKWIWLNSRKKIENSLPWCEDEFEENSECLNLDRTDHDQPWIYGLQCKRKQPFVCANEKIITTEASATPDTCVCPCEHTPVSMYYNHHTFLALFFTIKADEIRDYCKYFGGIPFTTSFPQQTQNYVLSNIRLSVDDHCACCNNQTNFWVNDNFNNTCTAINLGTNKIIKSIDCKTGQPFICEIFCSRVPDLKANENATTDCDWIESGSKVPYKSCKFSCGYDYSLFGPDRFTCDFYGWSIGVVEQYQYVFQFPECIATENSAAKLLGILNESKPEGIYFAIQESQDADYSTWMAVLQFVISVIQVYPISKELPLGLLTFNQKANIKIPFHATDSCQVLKMLSNMERSEDVENVYYDSALAAIQKEILKYQPNRKSLIFFFVDKENMGVDYDQLVDELQKNNDIVVIGVVYEKFIFDLDLVASLGRSYKLYTMKVGDYSALTYIALSLLDYRSTAINCSKDLYVVPDLSAAAEDLNQMPKPHLDFIQFTITFLVIKNFVPHYEAVNQCKNRYGGKLIEDFHADKLLKEADVKQFNIRHFWIQTNDDCTAADVYNNELKKHNCLTRYSFVCAVDCSTEPPTSAENNAVHQVYQIECSKEQILWGPLDLKCDQAQGGWTTNNHRISPFPKCLSSNQFTNKILKVLHTQRNVRSAGILFVLDESKSLSEEDFKTQIKFVDTVVRLYPASDILPYGLITFSATVDMKIPYHVRDSCKTINDLASIKKNTTGEIVYVDVIEQIDQQIAEFRPDKLTVIYFLVTGLYIGDLASVRRSVANLKIRWNVEIVVLKIGKFESYIVSEIATRDAEYNLNLFSIYSYPAYSELIDQLKNGEQAYIFFVWLSFCTIILFCILEANKPELICN